MKREFQQPGAINQTPQNLRRNTEKHGIIRKKEENYEKLADHLENYLRIETIIDNMKQHN